MHRVLSLVAVGVLGSFLVAIGCAGAPPAPTSAPTAAPVKAAAPAAPTKAPEPTKSVEPAAPTKAPEPSKPAAAKIDYPEKGKTITIVVGFPAGGVADLSIRIAAMSIEKELGTQVQVVNKPGASTQVGVTELSQAKPDGYTLGMIALPTTVTTYLDPEFKATYTRASFQPIALVTSDMMSIGVKADSPFKTMKDMVDAAKAAPEKVSVSSAGLLGLSHLMGIAIEQATGVKFRFVHFEGGPPSVTATIGGHTDASFNGVVNHVPHLKNGAMRVIAVADKEECEFVPGVKTMEAQGYKVYANGAYGLAAPVGTPREIAELVSGAIGKASTTPDFKKRVNDLGMSVKYLNPNQFGEYWSQMEDWTRPLLKLAR